MLFLSPLCALATGLAISTTYASPAPSHIARRAGTPSSEGVHDGFFYYYWTDQAANATYTNGPGGSFSIDWTTGTGGNLIGGKGWKPASSNRVIQFSGEWGSDANAYLAVYGWMRTPRVEYYIVENYGTYNPSTGATPITALEVDGSIYDIGLKRLVLMLPIEGQYILETIWSVRRDKRKSGKIDFGAHVRAWKEAGLKLGVEHFWQIMACEGYHSNGRCNITVSDATGA